MKYGFLRSIVVIGVMAAFSTTAMAEHRWSIYHWANKEETIMLKVVDSVTDDWQLEMDESLSRWSGSEIISDPDIIHIHIDMTVDSKDDSNRTRKRCKMQSGQIRICNASYGGTGWLGIATIGIAAAENNERVIVEASVKINDFYSSYWVKEGRKNHVMCQEIGHILGLNHTSTDGSVQGTCMDYSWELESQWPNTHDHVMLDEIYNHRDGFNSYDDGDGTDDPVDKPCRGKGCNKNDAGSTPMGVMIHSDRAFQLWVARRPGGGLWIHHVRLAVGLE